MYSTIDEHLSVLYDARAPDEYGRLMLVKVAQRTLAWGTYSRSVMDFNIRGRVSTLGLLNGPN